MGCDVILIHPPLWDMYSPPASMPALVGYLSTYGVAAQQVDLNQKYFKASCDAILAAALEDVMDETTFDRKIPYEHKVVLGTPQFDPDILTRHGIDRRDLTFDAYRRGVARWSLQQLNVVDALIHYGYFIRPFTAMNRVLQDRSTLEDEIWSSLRRIFESSCLQRIREERPGVVGFSILGAQQLPAAVACTSWLRSEYDGVIVWGGSEIRYTFDRMQDGRSWWRELIDYVCLGEGETALLRLAKRYPGRATDQLSRPVVSRRRQKGAAEIDSTSLVILDDIEIPSDATGEPSIPGLIRAPFAGRSLPRKNYEEVERLAPYNFDGIDLTEGYLTPEPVIPYQCSRGCHWGICAFCDHEEGYRLHYRPKSVAQVVDDMESFRTRWGVTRLQFVDEAIEPDWFEEFLTEIERRGLAGVYRWSNYSKISHGLTDVMLRRAYQDGCRMILFGVETFNQRLLQHVRKGVSRTEIFRTIKATSHAGLRCWIWLISGLPTQTPGELQQDVADLESVLPLIDAASVGRYRISANSDLARDPSAFGIVGFDYESPTEITCEHDGQRIEPEELARIYYDTYYPLAIKRSRSHNRYLILFDAIREERHGVVGSATAHGQQPVFAAGVVRVGDLAVPHSGPGDL